MRTSEPLSQPSLGGAALGSGIEAEFLYVVPGSERGLLYMYPPPPGTPRLSGQYPAHRMPISDARAQAAALSLDV